MKYKAVALTVLSLTYIISYAAIYTRKTTAIAAEEGYPVFIVNLRNKATDFETGEKIRMLVEIDDLRQQDLDYRADEQFEQYKKAYFDLEEDIDLLFDSISREFLAQAAELDRQGTSRKEKAALVARTKERATQLVTKKLQDYERIMKNNPSNIDS